MIITQILCFRTNKTHVASLIREQDRQSVFPSPRRPAIKPTKKQQSRVVFVTNNAAFSERRRDTSLFIVFNEFFLLFIFFNQNTTLSFYEFYYLPIDRRRGRPNLPPFFFFIPIIDDSVARNRENVISIDNCKYHYCAPNARPAEIKFHMNYTPWGGGGGGTVTRRLLDIFQCTYVHAQRLRLRAGRFTTSFSLFLFNVLIFKRFSLVNIPHKL